MIGMSARFLVILALFAATPGLAEEAESTGVCFVSGVAGRAASGTMVRLRFAASSYDECVGQIRQKCREIIQKDPIQGKLSAYFRQTLSSRESKAFELDERCQVTPVAP